MVLLLTIPFLLGLTLLVLGIRGRRINTHPTCRKCRYDLHALTGPTNCPECGSDLTKPHALGKGMRKRSQALIAVGASLSVIGFICAAGFALLAFNPTTLNNHKPVWLLTVQARFANSRGSVAALSELNKRLGTPEMPAAQVAKVVSLSLDIQGDQTRTWSTAWGDFIETARGLGFVTDSQWSRYARQSVQLTARTREHTRLGEPYAIKINATMRTAQRTVLAAFVTGFTPASDAKHSAGDYSFGFPSQNAGQSTSSATTRWLGRVAVLSRDVDTAWATPRATEPGLQTIRGPLGVLVIDQSGTSIAKTDRWNEAEDFANAKLAGPEVQTITSQSTGAATWCEFFTVTTSSVPRSHNILSLRRAESDVRSMQTACETFALAMNEHQFPGSKDPTVFCTLSLPKFPNAVAFDLIWLEPSDKETLLGTFVSEGPGDAPNVTISETVSRRIVNACRSKQRITLMFRPNLAAAYANVDITSIHGTEITLKDHPIRIN